MPLSGRKARRPRSWMIGCGTGDTLAALKPSHGVGVDFSPAMICPGARERHPGFSFHVGRCGGIRPPSQTLEGPFDYILVLDTIGAVDDCQTFLAQLHALCSRETRIVVGYFSHLWYSDTRASPNGQGRRMSYPEQNILSPCRCPCLCRACGFRSGEIRAAGAVTGRAARRRPGR